MVTIDEAAKCYKCNKTGLLIVTQKADSPSTREEVDLAVYECQTQLCLNYGITGRWIVQSDARGIVFERNRGPRGMDKDFVPMTNEARSRGKANVEEALGHELERDN